MKLGMMLICEEIQLRIKFGLNPIDLVLLLLELFEVTEKAIPISLV